MAKSTLEALLAVKEKPSLTSRLHHYQPQGMDCTCSHNKTVSRLALSLYMPNQCVLIQ